MLKILTIVISLIDPNQYAIVSSREEYETLDKCKAAISEFEAIVKKDFDEMVPGGVKVKSKCADKDEVGKVGKKPDDNI